MTTHYFSSVFGNDSYNGLAKKFVSGSTGPKASTPEAAAVFNAAAAGDSILFARGESWSNAALIALQNTNATASNRVRLGAYLHDDAPAVVTGVSTAITATTLTDSTQSWTTNEHVGKEIATFGLNGGPEFLIVTSNSATVLTFAVGWKVGNVPIDARRYTLQTRRPILTDTRNKGVGGLDNAFLDFTPSGVDGGYIVEDLDCRGGGTTSSLWGCFLSGSVRDVRVQRCTFDGFDIGIYAGAGNLRYEFLSVVAQNCPGLAGMFLLCNDVLVDRATLDNNGGDGDGGHNHNIYGSYSIDDDPSGPRNITIRGVTSLRCAQATGTSSSTAIVFHGNIRGLMIQAAYLYQTPETAGSGGYGIAVNTGNYGSVEGFHDVKVLDCIVVNHGQNPIDVSLCKNPLLDNNIVVLEQGCDMANFQGIVVAEQASVPGGSQVSTGAKLRNNSIYIDSRASFEDTSAISFAEGDGNGNDAGSDNVLSSNLIVFGPNVSGTHVAVKYGSRASSDFTAIDCNLYYDQSASGRYSTGTHMNYASMAAAQSGGIESGGIGADPLLVAIPSLSNGWQMQLQVGSPAIGAASSTYSVLRAHRGYPILSDRDIGALQKGSNYV